MDSTLHTIVTMTNAYKIFDGINWVDICNCDVRIKTIFGWQELKPQICVVKYWDGLNWCEVICEPPSEPCIIYSNAIVFYPVNLVTFYCSGEPIEYYASSAPLNNITQLVDDLNANQSWGEYTDNEDRRVKLVIAPDVFSKLGCPCENLTMEITYTEV